MFFNTLEFLSRNVKICSVSIPCPKSLLYLLIRHFFAVFLCDFRIDVIHVLSNMTLSYPMASQGDETSNVSCNLLFTTLPGILCFQAGDA